MLLMTRPELLPQRLTVRPADLQTMHKSNALDDPTPYFDYEKLLNEDSIEKTYSEITSDRGVAAMRSGSETQEVDFDHSLTGKLII